MFLSVSEEKFLDLCQSYSVNDRIPEKILDLFRSTRQALLESNLFEGNHDIEFRRKGAVILLGEILDLDDSIKARCREPEFRGTIPPEQGLMPY